MFLKIAQIVVLPKASTLAESGNNKLLLSKGTAMRPKAYEELYQGVGGGTKMKISEIFFSF